MPVVNSRLFVMDGRGLAAREITFEPSPAQWRKEKGKQQFRLRTAIPSDCFMQFAYDLLKLLR